jgi:hypothetical protein
VILICVHGNVNAYVLGCLFVRHFGYFSQVTKKDKIISKDNRKFYIYFLTVLPQP